ncbi:MAG: hypothetical protein LBD96_02245 [Treponema sp.]|nr:hypothetical protein [Treponema sp.]
MMAGCGSSPAASVPITAQTVETGEIVEIVGSTWTFSASAGSISYIFANDSAYTIETSIPDLQRALTLFSLSGDNINGVYSVSNQTVTLNPSSGYGIGIDNNGNITITSTEPFTITINNGSFISGGITYKKAK